MTIEIITCCACECGTGVSEFLCERSQFVCVASRSVKVFGNITTSKIPRHKNTKNSNTKSGPVKRNIAW